MRSAPPHAVGLVPQLRQLRASGKAKLAVSLHATTDEVRSWIVPTNRKYPLDQLLGALRELYPLPAKRGDDDENASSSSSSSSSEGGSTASEAVAHRSSAAASSASSGAGRLSVGGSDDFVVIEYVLLKGVNDSEDDARRLLTLLSGVYCMINLIVFNPHEGTRFERSDDEQVRRATAALLRVLTCVLLRCAAPVCPAAAVAAELLLVAAAARCLVQVRRFRQIVMQGGKVCTLRVSKGDDSAAACGQLGNPELSPRPAPLLKPPARLRAVLPGAAAAAAAAE